MPRFRYEALDQRGRRRRGHLDADSPRAARAALRARGLAPVTVSESGPESAGPTGWRRAPLSRSRRATWTRQLAALVAGGLPLERALASLADEADTAAERELVAHLRAEVSAGSPLATAMA
ncbi:type II secretion system F family protein, partial [Tepidimonas sp.]|uniref:type II secretion system F family protein n=1 Tax=Tepidimonas sp. TaxID=2002775 RepID=UPI0028CF6F07